MTRLERIVLDAVQEFGPSATVPNDIYPYVNARKWVLSVGKIYAALIRLEEDGYVFNELDTYGALDFEV